MTLAVAEPTVADRAVEQEILRLRFASAENELNAPDHESADFSTALSPAICGLWPLEFRSAIARTKSRESKHSATSSSASRCRCSSSRFEAPKSYAELIEMMKGFIPFAIAFFALIDIWFEHHHFFRRYSLHDSPTIALNTVLLFVILFYVYPLKFVFVMSVGSVLGHPSNVTPAQAANLFAIYGLGFAAVFSILGFMYRRAWAQRDALQLNEVERVDTLESIYDNFATCRSASSRQSLGSFFRRGSLVLLVLSIF